MTIRYVPNDPLAIDVVPAREQPPRPDPADGQAAFSYPAPVPEAVYAADTVEFRFWQCREAALAAREAELNRSIAAFQRESAEARNRPDPELEAEKERVARQVQELNARRAELETTETLLASQRERLDVLEQRIGRGEASLTERTRELDAREAELELKLAKLEADLEIREDKLERREAEVSSLQEKLAKKEADLTAYVGQLQGAVDDREADWWAKQLGNRPGSLAS